MSVATYNPTASDIKTVAKAIDIVQSTCFDRSQSATGRFDFLRMTSQVWVQVKAGADLHRANGHVDRTSDLHCSHDVLFVKFLSQGRLAEVELCGKNVLVKQSYSRAIVKTSDITSVSIGR